VSLEVAVLHLNARAFRTLRDNSTSASLVFFTSVSICHRGLMSQLISTRRGGSYASTRAQWHSLPSTPRS
jgi:hypothetical protein